MDLTEAQHVQRFCRWFLGVGVVDPTPDAPPPTVEEARDALLLLAQASRHELGGRGYSGADVARIWLTDAEAVIVDAEG